MKTASTVTCFHCGDTCNEQISYDGHTFCCWGCKNVYTVLQNHSLKSYYEFEPAPGIKPLSTETNHASIKNQNPENKFAFLDNFEIIDELVTKIGQDFLITLKLPAIHCTSCVWLLENLHRINPGIHQVRVNFLKRTAKIVFNHEAISLRSLVELISSIGYTPELNLNSTGVHQNSEKFSSRLVIQIAVAGFGFGNIMLFSLPEYLGLNRITEIAFVHFFGYFNFLLSIPIVFFSGSDYFTSAWSSFKYRVIGIDVPIALGITALFTRSIYEVISGVGSGYFDSLAGLVFFLLLGRVFQEYTYHSLFFENDYRSYFPIAIHKRAEGNDQTISIKEIFPGDELIIFPGQIIPVDAKLLDDKAEIDLSFITGEAEPVLKQKGEHIKAGGKNLNTKITVVAIKKFSHSSFMEIWNHEVFTTTSTTPNPSSGYQSVIIKRISKSFTLIVLGLASIGAAYWYLVFNDISKAIEVFTAILIVACPCALALSSPTTLGIVLRILQQNGFFIKNTESLEKIADLTTIVFDKTGTLTSIVKEVEKIVDYKGEKLFPHHIKALYLLTQYSSHPLSIILNRYFKNIYPSLQNTLNREIQINTFKELPGKGVVATCGKMNICYGSSKFVDSQTKSIKSAKLSADTNAEQNNHRLSEVHIMIDHHYYGYFTIRQSYRQGLKETLTSLRKNYQLALLTGDNPGEKKILQTYFKSEETLKFSQTPIDKLNWIQVQQQQGNRVMMLGDGLNDAGALKQSDVGIALTEDIRGFSPACDAILSASAFDRIPKLLSIIRFTRLVVTLSLLVSFSYNILGIFFGLSGKLSPIIAAILMPLSSMTIVFLIIIMLYLNTKKNRLKFI